MKEEALKRFFSFRRILIYGKVWAQRTMSWIAVLNSAMILFLVLAKLQEYGISISITHWFIPIFILLVMVMIFFGYLEDRAGFHREEIHEIAKRNPVYTEILERLERIEKKISQK
jgi:glucan phosphoethanolaminetransferase (alkaline phosphatase superfamily)